MNKTLSPLLLAALLAGSQAGAAATAKAYFAGGSFWAMESDFEHLPGVVSAVSGYAGGKEPNPTFEQVSDHKTGHAEAVEVTYDPARLSYDQLLDYYWHHIDPLTPDAQFCDHGAQFRSVIFYGNPAEQQAAQKSKDKFEKQLGKPIVTQLAPASGFYPAEDYHQNYYLKNPVRYKYYRFACGRDARIKEIWGEPAPAN